VNLSRSVSQSAIALALGCAVLVGCSPAPAPTPTQTPAFGSEEEAFAAAEETYEAYTKALNAVDASNPRTFEATYEYTSGSFQRSDRENFSFMKAEGVTIDGEAVVLSFAGAESSPTFEQVTALVCLDVSGVTVVDASGVSVVNPDRPDIYAVRATFAFGGERMLVDAAERTEDETCARLG